MKQASRIFHAPVTLRARTRSAVFRSPAYRVATFTAAVCMGLGACLWAEAAKSADALTRGADLSDCRSALQVGPAHCRAPTAPGNDGAGGEAGSGSSGWAGGSSSAAEQMALEARVDAFLAAYGKPPREAVRALLDPSDAHIRAYLQKRQETLAVAAYVASRMTALQEAQAATLASSSVKPSAAAARDPAAFQQLRVWLVREGGDADGQDAQEPLRALVRQFPAIQAGVSLVGDFSARALRQEVTAIGPLLSVRVVAADAVDEQSLPYVQIEDLRERRVAIVSARSLTLERLVGRILALRQEAPATAAASPAASASAAPAPAPEPAPATATATTTGPDPGPYPSAEPASSSASSSESARPARTKPDFAHGYHR